MLPDIFLLEICGTTPIFALHTALLHTAYLHTQPTFRPENNALRNHKIDLMRYVGLVMIVIAHLSPSDLLHQLRNFDVPLMVLISGASFQLSHRPGEPYGHYLFKRFRRLVLPVWVFCTLYFLTFLLYNPNHAILQPNTVLESYLLMQGFGYVWVVRVFLLVAMVAPLLRRINLRLPSNAGLFGFLAVGLALYQGLRWLAPEQYLGSVGTAFLDSYLYYVIPYGLVFLLGMRLIQLSPAMVRRMGRFFLLTFLVLAVWYSVPRGEFLPTQVSKYPAGFYYLSYALLVSMFLWLRSDQLWNALPGFIRQYVLFTSKNSIWIYLWHIPLIRWASQSSAPLAYELVITLAASTVIVLLQVRLVDWFSRTNFFHARLRRNLRIILTG
ncbi:acyltransferase family protein [Lewinella sp. IMCC34183]|uniref:acyltransferase family protein n=1 Tax=Lewinella sp. IMCC34183 TaxID=2248762 RepID=UPI000E288239|nr:acyltransferase [Lewinella sp. IMCC34183]